MINLDPKFFEQLGRALVSYARTTAPDQDAATFPRLYPVWAADEAIAEGDRRYYPPTDKVYKCRQAHTTQASWTPDATPAMWSVIDVAHAGTPEDPIPAARGMDYIYGKHYRDPEDSKVYLCARAGEAEGGIINLQYLPHEVVGQYFEVV